MSRLSLEVGFKTDVGRQRERNEDSFAIYVPYPGDENPSGLAGLLVVADGMGGERAGDRASQLAAERLRSWLTAGVYREWPEHAAGGLDSALRRAVRQVSDEIFQLGEADPTIRGLGSTLVLAAFTEPAVTVVNVGDSRCYRIRGEAIERLSVDHSWVGRQVEAGVLSPEEARVHPQRNVLTRSLGDAMAPESAVRSEPVREGDLFVLCSDGLTGGLTDEDILAEAKAHPSPQLLADALVERANERDGSDNVTVVVGRCHTEDEDTVELPPISGELVKPTETPTVPNGTATSKSAAETPTLSEPAATSAGRRGGLGWTLLAFVVGAALGVFAPRIVGDRLVDQAEAYRVAGELGSARERCTSLLRLVFGAEGAERLLDMLRVTSEREGGSARREPVRAVPQDVAPEPVPPPSDAAATPPATAEPAPTEPTEPAPPPPPPTEGVPPPPRAEGGRR